MGGGVNGMNRLQNLVADLLEREGALVEAIEPEGLEVLAPPQVREALGVPDWCRLGFGPNLPAGAQRLGLEGDWLERLDRVLGDRGRRLRRVVAPDNPAPGSPERLLEHTLDLGNAVWRFRAVRAAWTRYLVFTYRYSALSDEKREGLVQLGVNLATGATMDGLLDRLMARLDDAEELPEAVVPPVAPLPPDWDPQRAGFFLERVVPDRVNRHLEAFLNGMRRRQQRDQARLRAYHEGLRRESVARLQALQHNQGDERQSDDKRARERSRLEAIAREYAAKTHDLQEKFALKVTIEWVQTLELVMPVQRLEVLIRRRKGERLLTIDWNPLARQIETPPCEASFTADRPRVVCDDALHLISPAQKGACPGCGREYCRACHPSSCPKCGHRATGELAVSSPGD
jgi:hypothetical protein